MARTQSKKRRLFGFAQQSNSTPGLSLPPGTSQARAGGFASVSESSGMASAGKLARMRRLFHRSKRGTPATIASEVADREISGGVGEQREQLQAAPPQGVRYLYPIAAMTLKNLSNRLPRLVPMLGLKMKKRKPRQFPTRTLKSQPANQSLNQGQSRTSRRHRLARMSMLQ
ncbi:hypothetical protein EV401DRAFT_361521 [Pisolithus croceorrhizus]|nr:hypothetical protein EV401DRAFT_361521 [Pisolithus croceorrhizus]